MFSDLEYHASRILAYIPIAAVLLVGAILAIQKLKQSPRAYWCLLAAFAVDLGSSLILPFLSEYMDRFWLAGSGVEQNHRFWYFLLRNLPYTISSILIWVLVLIAIFDRPQPPKFLVEDDFEPRDNAR